MVSFSDSRPALRLQQSEQYIGLKRVSASWTFFGRKLMAWKHRNRASSFHGFFAPLMMVPLLSSPSDYLRTDKYVTVCMLNASRDSQFFEVLPTLVAWCGDRMDNKLGYLIVLHVDVIAMYSISVNT